MKTRLFSTCIFAIIISIVAHAQPWKEHGKLHVSPENPHYLAFQDGKPFFWLADTGWEMLNRLNRAEIETYLENRKAKGFNVIQTVRSANSSIPTKSPIITTTVFL